MAATNFYLKDPKAKEETLIYLFHSRNGQRYKFSTGEKIHPKHWNDKEQCIRKSYSGSADFNHFLTGLSNDMNEIFREAITKKVTPTIDYIRDQLRKRMNKDVEVKKELFFYLEEFIDLGRSTKKANTVKKIISLRNHLKAFQTKRQYKISFEKLDMKFYENFLSYLIKDCKHLNSSIGKTIQHLKTFLHWSTERGYNTNTAFLKFKVFKTESDLIYLTEKELMRIYGHDLSDNKRLDQVRDVFCFGCFTGLRYSDLFQLRRSHVKGEEIHFTTVKTNDKLIVPLNDFAKDILKKYDFKLPVISNQKTNKYLKEIGKIEELKLGDEVILSKKRGGEDLEFKEPKYNLIGMHTSRRTFITLSLEKGMRPEVVMSITGHKDYKTFKKYIKLIPKVKLVEMKRIWHKEPIFKAV